MAGDIFTKDELFALVKETTEITKQCDLGRREGVREPSEETKEDYAKIGRSRLNLDRDDFGRLMDGVSRQSWAKVRAALLYEAERVCIEQRRLCDVLQRAWRAAKTEAERAEAFELAAQAAQRANRAAQAFVCIQNDETKPSERSKPKASKRKSLPPPAKPDDEDWRVHLFENVNPRYWPSLLALWVGARPAEVEKGVKFEYVEAENGTKFFNVWIPGAKISENSGQEWRQICLAAKKTDLTGALVKYMKASNSMKFKAQRPAQRLNKDFKKFVAWGLVKKDTSPYSLRHAFTADLKAEGWHPEQIAAALGHASARSQNNYGSVKQGRTGGLGVIGVEAERAVRTEWNKGLNNKRDYDYDSPSL